MNIARIVVSSLLVIVDTIHRRLTLINPKVVSITLTRAEGPIGECRKPVTVKSWEDAQAVLSKWGVTAPTPGNGYDKVDFSVVFYHESGPQDPYNGRYDLTYGGLESDGSNLVKHIYDWVKYVIKNPHNRILKSEVEIYKNFMREIFKENVSSGCCSNCGNKLIYDFDDDAGNKLYSCVNVEDDDECDLYVKI